jgi:hypothetical protein
MALYAITLPTVGVLHDEPYWPAPPLKYVLALLPALPVFGAIWAIFAHIEDERDEYWRHLHIKAQLLASAATLAIATALEFAIEFGGPLPFATHIFSLYITCLTLAMAWISWRAR